LETASALELYSEGFRTTEDIYLIMQISKRTPKAKLMATYYEKLIGIFWVSENLLFHAFAWYKYYTLCKEYNKNMTAEMSEKQATCVVLAALSIPTLDGLVADGNASADAGAGKGRNKSITTMQEEIAKEKTARMATLLGFQTHPSRSALLAELKAKGVIRSLPSYLQELYCLLEDHSDPLTLVTRAAPLLNEISKKSEESSDLPAVLTSASSASSPNPARYIGPMQNVILLKLMSLLSATYHTVSLTHLQNLTKGLGLPFEQVEKIIVVAQGNRVLVKIDHLTNALRFGSVELEGDELRGHLQSLAHKLSLVAEAIVPSDKSKALKQRQALFSEVRANLKTEHKSILERKNEIERRKEELERLVQEKIREEIQKKAEIEATRKAEEARRLALESRMREKEKSLRIQQELEEMEKKKYLKALGKAAEEFDEAQLATMDAAQLAKEHADRKNKEKEEAERKQKDTAKRLDHITRAIRIEETPLILKNLEDRRQSEKKQYEDDLLENTKQARTSWEQNTKMKEQLDKYQVFKYLPEFEGIVMKDRKKAHEILCRKAEMVAEKKAKEQKYERALKRMKDEKRRKAEEQARQKAEEEARRKEEERRAKEEELERARKEEEERQNAEREKAAAEQAKISKEQEETAPAAPAKYVPPSKRGLADRSVTSTSGTANRSLGGSGYGGGRYDRDSRMRSGGDRYGDSRGSSYRSDDRENGRWGRK
jgi:translation initiation factor 3 subunit A